MRGRPPRPGCPGRGFPTQIQKTNFSANWICRALPASPVGERVVWILPRVVAGITAPVVAFVIVPNEELGTQVPAGKVCPANDETVNGADEGVQTPPGCPRLGWLKMLKTSVRNSSLKRSVTDVVFKTGKSKLLKPGPTTWEFARSDFSTLIRPTLNDGD